MTRDEFVSEYVMKYGEADPAAAMTKALAAWKVLEDQNEADRLAQEAKNPVPDVSGQLQDRRAPYPEATGEQS